MPTVNYTSALKRFFPKLEPTHTEASHMREVLNELEKMYPGIKDYIIDESGALRQHVNIFINGNLIQDTETLDKTLSPQDEVYILQALSGG